MKQYKYNGKIITANSKEEAIKQVISIREDDEFFDIMDSIAEKVSKQLGLKYDINEACLWLPVPKNIEDIPERLHGRNFTKEGYMIVWIDFKNKEFIIKAGRAYYKKIKCNLNTTVETVIPFILKGLNVFSNEIDKYIKNYESFNDKIKSIVATK